MALFLLIFIFFWLSLPIQYHWLQVSTQDNKPFFCFLCLSLTVTLFLSIHHKYTCMSLHSLFYFLWFGKSIVKYSWHKIDLFYLCIMLIIDKMWSRLGRTCMDWIRIWALRKRLVQVKRSAKMCCHIHCHCHKFNLGSWVQ